MRFLIPHGSRALHLSIFQQPDQSLKMAPVDADVTIFAYLAR
jgi:hypothetical protein